VEDDPNFADCVKSLLEMNGYGIVVATNGEEGRLRFREHAGQFDLLLTDLVLPKLSGNRLADELRLEQPGLRVLFMSGYDNADSRVKPGPGIARLQKPFSLNTLLVRVRELLDGPANTGL